MEARVLGQPGLDVGVLVGRVVIEDQMDLQALGYLTSRRLSCLRTRGLRRPWLTSPAGAASVRAGPRSSEPWRARPPARGPSTGSPMRLASRLLMQRRVNGLLHLLRPDRRLTLPPRRDLHRRLQTVALKALAPPRDRRRGHSDLLGDPSRRQTVRRLKSAFARCTSRCAATCDRDDVSSTSR